MPRSTLSNHQGLRTDHTLFHPARPFAILASIVFTASMEREVQFSNQACPAVPGIPRAQPQVFSLSIARCVCIGHNTAQCFTLYQQLASLSRSRKAVKWFRKLSPRSCPRTGCRTPCITWRLYASCRFHYMLHPTGCQICFALPCKIALTRPTVSRRSPSTCILSVPGTAKQHSVVPPTKVPRHSLCGFKHAGSCRVVRGFILESIVSASYDPTISTFQQSSPRAP